MSTLPSVVSSMSKSDDLGNVGEGTLGVAELADDHVVGLKTCEGGVDVVGVVTPLVRGGAQVVLHGDQVVELSVLLGVREKGEVEEDGEGQVEVEREEGEVKEKRSCMTMNVDRMRLKNTLSHEVHVTQTSRGVTRLRGLNAVLTGCATWACRCSCTCPLM